MHERVATRIVRDLADQPARHRGVEHVQRGVDRKAHDLGHDVELELGAADGGRIEHRVSLGAKRGDPACTVSVTPIGSPGRSCSMKNGLPPVCSRRRSDVLIRASTAEQRRDGVVAQPVERDPVHRKLAIQARNARREGAAPPCRGTSRRSSAARPLERAARWRSRRIVGGSAQCRSSSTSSSGRPRATASSMSPTASNSRRRRRLASTGARDRDVAARAAPRPTAGKGPAPPLRRGRRGPSLRARRCRRRTRTRAASSQSRARRSRAPAVAAADPIAPRRHAASPARRRGR